MAENMNNYKKSNIKLDIPLEEEEKLDIKNIKEAQKIDIKKRSPIADTKTEFTKKSLKEDNTVINNKVKEFLKDDITELDNSLLLDKELKKMSMQTTKLQKILDKTEQENLTNNANINSITKSIMESTRYNTDVISKYQESFLEKLSNINTNLDNIKIYNVSSAVPFYKKSLELQYKQYYTAKELLTETKKMQYNMLNELKAITFNTGLNDAAKYTTGELVKDKLKNFLAPMPVIVINNEPSMLQRYFSNHDNLRKTVNLAGSMGSKKFNSQSVGNYLLNESKRLDGKNDKLSAFKKSVFGTAGEILKDQEEDFRMKVAVHKSVTSTLPRILYGIYKNTAIERLKNNRLLVEREAKGIEREMFFTKKFVIPEIIKDENKNAKPEPFDPREVIAFINKGVGKTQAIYKYMKLQYKPHKAREDPSTIDLTTLINNTENDPKGKNLYNVYKGKAIDKYNKTIDYTNSIPGKVKHKLNTYGRFGRIKSKQGYRYAKDQANCYYQEGQDLYNEYEPQVAEYLRNLRYKNSNIDVKYSNSNTTNTTRTYLEEASNVNTNSINTQGSPSEAYSQEAVKSSNKYFDRIKSSATSIARDIRDRISKTNFDEETAALFEAYNNISQKIADKNIPETVRNNYIELAKAISIRIKKISSKDKKYNSEKYKTILQAAMHKITPLVIRNLPKWKKALVGTPDEGPLLKRIFKRTNALDRKIVFNYLPRAMKYTAKSPFKAMGWGWRKFKEIRARKKGLIPNNQPIAEDNDSLGSIIKGMGIDYLKANGMSNNVLNLTQGKMPFMKEQLNQAKTTSKSTFFKASGKVLQAGKKIGIVNKMLPMDMSEDKLAKAVYNANVASDTQKEVNDSKKLSKNNKATTRVGNFLDRLKSFGKKKITDFKSKGIVGVIKENPSTVMTVAILGITALLNKLGVTMEDIKNFGSKTFGILKSIYSSLAGTFGKVGGWLGFGEEKKPKLNPDGSPVLDEKGEPVYEEGIGTGAKIAAGATMAAAGYTAYAAIKHPFKAVKVITPGTKLFNSIVGVFKNSFITKPIASIMEKNPKPVINTLEKVAPHVEKGKTTFNKFKSLLSNKKVQQKVGQSTIRKASGKIGTMIAASMTGIGGILASAMALWEIGWIAYYMYSEKLSFTDAACKQFLGMTYKELTGDSKEDLLDNNSKTDIVTTSSSSIPSTTLTVNNQSLTYSGSNITSISNGNIDSKISPMIINSKTDISKTSSNTLSYSGGKGVYSDDMPVNSITGKQEPLSNSEFKQTGSHYIIPSDKNTNISGMKPVMKARLHHFAKDFYQTTNKKIVLSEASRTLERQIYFWEKFNKVKYTGNKEKDIAAAKRNGTYSRQAAYPSESAPHIAGYAFDLKATNIPNSWGYTSTRTRSKLDDLLETHGLTRPFTDWNNKYGRTREWWHIEPKEGYSLNVCKSGIRDEDLVDDVTIVKETDSKTANTMEKILKKEDVILKKQTEELINPIVPTPIKSEVSTTNVVASTPSVPLGSNELTISNTDSNTNRSLFNSGNVYDDTPYQDELPKTPAPIASSIPTTSVIANNSNNSISTSKIEDTLLKSLDTQINMLKVLKSIESNLKVDNKSVNNSNNYRPSEDMPNPIIDISRKEIS